MFPWSDSVLPPATFHVPPLSAPAVMIAPELAMPRVPLWTETVPVPRKLMPESIERGSGAAGLFQQSGIHECSALLIFADGRVGRKS